MKQLPTGTVTFFFTDIAGSTRLLQELGDEYGQLQDQYMRLMRAAIAEGEGTEIQTEGDSFFAVFPSVHGAVRAAVRAQREFAANRWPRGRSVRVRMGMHTGEGRLGGDNYLGIDVNRAARIAAAGHGGQVLLSDSTRSLVQNFLSQDIALKDLNRHRLKDLNDPIHLYQLVIEGLENDFPNLKTAEAPVQLPPEPTSFVGRSAEIEEIAGLLLTSRLITLTGPGGSGKTRLSVRAAAAVADRFPDGVTFVELAPVTDAALVPSMIASALGIREEGPRPILQTLQSELHGKQALLVLDNFEQVMEAAAVVSMLLASADRTRCLVTSRGPLHLQAEQEFSVVPLQIPEPGALNDGLDPMQFEAIALFAERARAVDPGFRLEGGDAELVAEICRRLDGLPLAIELAASRVRLLTPAEMLDRLDDALSFLAAGARDLPARQRTLRGAIGWSYDLLEDPSRRLFRRLAVFVSGFTLQAAQRVCDPRAELGGDILEPAEPLLDTGLIRRSEQRLPGVRFNLLHTIREFAMEQLEAAGEREGLSRAHAEYFLTIVSAAEPGLRGPHAEDRLAALEAEHDNVRAALAWTIEYDAADIGLRLAAGLWRFWHLRGHLTEGRRWLSEVLALPAAKEATAARAKGLIAAGSLAYWQTDTEATREAYEEALAMSRELGDKELLAEATFNAAFWHPFVGDFAGAVSMLREATRMFEELGNRLLVGDALSAISILVRLQGRPLEESWNAGQEALSIHGSFRDNFGMATSHLNIGTASLAMGDVDIARTHFLQGLDAAEQIGDRTGMKIALDNLADLENSRGRYLRAMRLGGASETLKEAVGGEAPPALVHLPDPRIDAGKHLSEADIQAAWEEGRAMSLEAALAYARKAD